MTRGLALRRQISWCFSTARPFPNRTPAANGWSTTPFLLCFNAHGYAVEFLTPDGIYAQRWTAILDTVDPACADDPSSLPVRPSPSLHTHCSCSRRPPEFAFAQGLLTTGPVDG